jgi:isopentenyl-diphosphate Delta-isomerase
MSVILLMDIAMSKSIAKRKIDHIKIALSPDSQVGDPGFLSYRFPHNALPEIDFDKIDTTTLFLGKKVSVPFLVSCMTGGVEKGAIINKNLALACQKKKIALGVGSQRAAVEDKSLRGLFAVRKYAPDIPVMANVGLVQLNYGFGLKELKELVDMVDADVLVFHLNPVQEAIQPEGDRNFENLLPKLEKVVSGLNVPVAVKEVGFGLSYDVVKRLFNTGVRIFDTAGWGGTNWAFVEGKRRKGRDELGGLFAQWGIPTTESIKQVKKFKDEVGSNKASMVILGSGGVRTGVDVAKCLALGADLAGLATPFAKVAIESADSVEKLLDKLTLELKIAMFGTGTVSLKELRKVKLIEVG